jgi:dTDP-4-dehydrorhamnose 3,5-epimerase
MHTFSDDRGRSAMSIFDGVAALGGAQLNASAMYAGAVKAWHRHFRQDDHWCVLSGNLKIGLFNTEAGPLAARLSVATDAPGGETLRTVDVAPGRGEAVYLGEHRAGVLHIPARMWHGGVAVGGRDALLLYCVTRRYDPANPDEERRAWDAFAFDWGVGFK